MKWRSIKNKAIVALILSTVLFSCASRKNKRAAKELKSPEVEIVVAESDEAKTAKKEEAAAVPTDAKPIPAEKPVVARSEEHTSELQSRENLVCRLLLEKKKQQ